ncbi:MAG: hypothetical protein FJX52_03535, partial [Alphaproteobacteria bacterium]|nr:hypothetical protein [Alphaproteobacteria bacterium]
MACPDLITHPRSARPMVAAALLALLLATTPFARPARAADAGAPGWEPRVVERLVKLPGTHLKRAIDDDFANSALGGALVDAE